MKTLLAAVAVFTCLSAGCAHPSEASRATPAAPETVQLRIGEHKQLGTSELRVVFEKVVSDSRCPIGVTCVWEGDAVVELTIRDSAATRATIRLHAHPQATQEAKHGAFVLRLLALEPHPTADGPPKPDTYRLRLQVTEGK